MNIKASGRSALIVAAAVWACFSSPLQAAEDADGGTAVSKTETAGAPVALSKFTRKSRHWRHASSHRKSARMAGDTSENARLSRKKKADDADAAPNAGEAVSALPPSVANANAQLAAADVTVDVATALSAQASDRLQTLAANQFDPQPAANLDLVAADQLNDVDRALSESKSDDNDKAAAATVMAAAPMPSQTQAAQAPVVSTEDSTWGQTSLIGKIFIAFGGLLTLASAARMFMT